MSKAFSFEHHDGGRIRSGSAIVHGGNAVGRMVKALVEWAACQASVSRLCKEFAAMSDAQLADVGIGRADIRRVVTRPTARGNSLSSMPPRAAGERGRRRPAA